MNLLLPWRRRAPAEDHERIFVERLGRVMQWARQIASGDASLAEDLAQDAFLHFTAGKPSLDEISNIDKYLYVVLKNLFRSHLAAVSRRCAVPLDPLAHESVLQTWNSVDPERRLVLREELRRICTFICDRKETSKGASAFLLHFFHGLSLSEVVIVMQTTRGAVDERLSVVRKEVRRHIERRTPLLVKSTAEAEPLAELQSIIAASCRGACFSADEAQGSYAPGAAELARDRLAHLASCSKCLSLVTQVLQFPTDPGSSAPVRSTDSDRISRWKRRREELWLTEPTELRLMVNGHLLATERVHPPDNQFSVSIALHEPVEFVEIWSGESTRLLFLPGISEPPEGQCDQRASIDLSTGNLQLILRFQEPWPTVAVSYTARESERPVQAQERTPASFIDFNFQREITSGPLFGRLFVPTLSATIALSLIVVLLFVQTRETTLSAAEVLDRAGKWEQRVTTTQAPVLHRRFSLVKQDKGVTVERTYVEVWRRAGLNMKLSRWADASGRKLAEARVVGSGQVRFEPGNIWQFEPSVEAFEAAAGPLDHAAVSITSEHTSIRVPLAELVVDRETNRPIEERFSIGSAEYVFTEAFTETIPLAGSPLSPPPVETGPVEKRNRVTNESNDPEPPSAHPDFRIEERELEVRKELHTLDLATTASITTHDNAIDVQFAPASVEQEKTLRAALEQIPGVNVSAISAKAAVLNSVMANSPASALAVNENPGDPLAAKWLKPVLGSEFEVHAEEERRLQTARHLVTLVAEWRLLAERYPAAVERLLSAPAESTLHTIVSDLRMRILEGLHSQQIALNEIVGDFSDAPDSPANVSPCATWQSQGVRAADLLWENEQANEQFYAPGPSGRAAGRDNDILRRLRSLTNSLTSLLRISCIPR